jgi:hypothetical protein
MAILYINNNSNLLEPYISIVDDKYDLSSVSGQTMRASYQSIYDYFEVFAETATDDLIWSANNGWISLNEYTTAAIEFESYDYAFRYEGSFSSYYSTAYKFEIYQKSTGTLWQQFGNLVWQGGPLYVVPDLASSSWTGNALLFNTGEIIGISGYGTYVSNGDLQGTVYKINTVVPATSATSDNAIDRGQITIAGGFITGGTITDLHAASLKNANHNTYKDSVTMSSLSVRVDMAPSALMVNAGNDEICLVGTVSAEGNGGDGNDTITSGAASDRLVGGAGDDIMFSPVDFSDRDIFSPALLDNLLYVTSMLDNYRKNENSHRATGRSL